MCIRDRTPGKPTLISPPNRSTTDNLKPTFDWNDVAQATSYHIQVSTDSRFRSTTIDTTTTDSTYTPADNLAAKTRYYWHVRACNEYGCSDWSRRWYFRTPEQ